MLGNKATRIVYLERVTDDLREGWKDARLELSELRTENAALKRGRELAFEVTEIEYNTDADDVRFEMDRTVTEFDNLVDARHLAADRRVFGDNTVLLAAVETKKTPLYSDGTTIGGA